MSRQELSWRLGCTLRTAAQHTGARVRAPRWDRTALRQALSHDCLDRSMRAAIAAGDWPRVHARLAARIAGRDARFVLNPRSSTTIRQAVKARWPEAAAAAAARADAILAGRYDLLGYRGLAVDAPIDWHADPVHRRRAPELFWSRVPYLDPRIGDHKVIWELNRHQHWQAVSRALWLTGDPRYGDAIVGQLGSWMQANPPLIGVNWASMLEIGFRAISWTWGLHALLAVDAQRERGSWLVDMLIGLDRQLTHVEHNLSYYFSPNTHLTGEALALYVVGQALPELASSGRWSALGRSVLIDEIERQILPDGGHAERSTHYQRYTLDFYLLALLTAQRTGDRIAAATFADAVTRLAAFTRAIADDEGRLPLIGDDDGGMLWPICGRACADVRDSLAVAAVLLDEPALAPGAVPEEAVWVGGDEVMRRLPSFESTAAADTAPPLRSCALRETGYVIVRDGAGSHAVLDAGAHGYQNAGHAHADPLSITLTLAGLPLLVDPGTSTYTMNRALRDRLRSTESHNTLTIDGAPAAHPAGPFHWRTRADGRLHGWRGNAAFDWVQASHDGYAPLLHRRTLLRTSGSGWLVVDRIAGEGVHTGVVRWHFDPEWAVDEAGVGRLRARRADGHRAWLLHDADMVRLVRGDEDGAGWHAPVYGTLVPAWTAELTREAAASFSALTWIGSSATAPALARLAHGDDGQTIVARVTAGARQAIFLLREDPFDTAADRRQAPDYHTDARVLHYAQEHDRLAAIDMIDGTSVVAQREGWMGVSCSATISDLHIEVAHGRMDLQCSTPPAELRLHRAPTAETHAVRVNGRELPQPAHRDTHFLLINGGSWGDDVHAAIARRAEIASVR